MLPTVSRAGPGTPDGTARTARLTRDALTGLAPAEITYERGSLRALTVRGGPWWTVGFEAFGREDRQQKLLPLVAREALRDFPLPLEEKSCFDYPQWIATLPD